MARKLAMNPSGAGVSVVVMGRSRLPVHRVFGPQPARVSVERECVAQDHARRAHPAEEVLAG